MVGPDHETHGVRHHESDEADDAGDGDARRGDERGDHERDPLHPLDVGAQVVGGLLTDGQEVQRAGHRDEKKHGRGRVDGGQQDAPPGGAREAAHDPQDGALHGPRG